MKTQVAVALIAFWSSGTTSSWGSEQRQFSASNSPSEKIKEENNTMVSGEIAAAKSLQGDLRTTFDHLKSTGSLSSSMSGTDITPMICHYINTNTSFTAAERILKDAGFEINHPDLINGPTNVNKAVDWYAVVARVSSYENLQYGKSSVFVTLLPKAPGDYSKIVNATATIFTQFL